MKLDDKTITQNTLLKIISDCKSAFHIGANSFCTWVVVNYVYDRKGGNISTTINIDNMQDKN